MEAPDRECLDLKVWIIIIYYIFLKKFSFSLRNQYPALMIEGFGQGKFVHNNL